MGEGVEVQQGVVRGVVLLSHWPLGRVKRTSEEKTKCFVTSSTKVISPSLSVPGNQPGPWEVMAGDGRSWQVMAGHDVYLRRCSRGKRYGGRYG